MPSTESPARALGTPSAGPGTKGLFRGVMLVVVFSLFTLAGAAYGLLRAGEYTATALVRVSPRAGTGERESSRTFLQEVIGAVGTDRILRLARERAGWQGSRGDFEERLDVRPFSGRGGEPQGIEVRFSSDDGRLAARVANTYAGVFTRRVDELGRGRLVGASLGAEARIARRAVPPSGGPARRASGWAVAGAISGLAASAATLLIGRRRGWWDGVGDRDAFGAPVLGMIPEYLEGREIGR